VPRHGRATTPLAEDRMKILLISPSRGPNVKQQKSVMFPQLALDLLAGLTPPEHTVTIVEEEYEAIDLEADCDLVGLSCLTSTAPRCYDLAREFKMRGKTVVMGGVHPTILPDEALAHADAVVVGEAEGVWAQLLDDVARGCLARKYHRPCPPLDTYVPVRPRRGIRKGFFDVVPVMTTRGCPYSCDFCCVHDIYGAKVRHAPIENVIRHLKDSGGRIFMFLDDNIMGDPHYARELFRAMAPLGIKWGGQASPSFFHNAELLSLARQSGCGALFFGVESVAEARLAKLKKSVPRLEKLADGIQRVRRAGIYPVASVVFGFDEDTPDAFRDTVRFLKATDVGTATFNILTPYPGTKVYRQLKAEGRIFTDDWTLYNHNTAVFTPSQLSVPELLAGRLWARNEFSRAPAAMRRLPANWRHPLLHVVANRASQRSATNQIRAFPRVASDLCHMQSLANGDEKAFAPGDFRFSDFAPAPGA
jgi:radical SAM superfamily enzyme YgiQ (UPF0313 family)